MEPIGLTTKRGRNKYANERDGELMLIHRCSGCGAIVINRIAADDRDDLLLDIFELSCRPSAALQAELIAQGITLLLNKDRGLVQQRLFGDGTRPVRQGYDKAAD